MAPADGLTHLQAVEREGVLAHELVVGCGVVVFDDEAHQRQLWHVHVELEAFVPRRVETSKREKSCGKTDITATQKTQLLNLSVQSQGRYRCCQYDGSPSRRSQPVLQTPAL